MPCIWALNLPSEKLKLTEFFREKELYGRQQPTWTLPSKWDKVLYLVGFAKFDRGRREESIISSQENVGSENKECNEYEHSDFQSFNIQTSERSYHPSNDPRGQRTIKTKKICIIIMIIYSVKFCFDTRHSKQTSMHRGEGKICHWKLESIYLQFNLKKHQVFPFP